MSNLIGAAQPIAILQMKDRRIIPNFQVIHMQRDRIKDRHAATDRYGGFTSDFWPGNHGMGENAPTEATWSRVLSRLGHGEASRVGFPGVTRDQYGTPLAACTVILHRTSTRELVYDGVSNADGAFLAQSVYAGENHYIVFHKAGAVNVYGATDNNLVGA